MRYRPPLRDIAFDVLELVDFAALARLPGYADAPGVAVPILEEAGRFATDVLAPLDAPGERVGARLVEGRVVTPPGFAAAYRRYADAGWISLGLDPAHGGGGLPGVLVLAVEELFEGANTSFAMAPMLNRGSVEAIAFAGTAEQQREYIPNLLAGRWTATMELTEAQAGSDLGLIRALAVPHDGAYRLSGQKSFITYGSHDFTENIMHLVLARTPGAPAGTRGISMFIVPEWVDTDGVRRRNDVRCTSIERKLGLHASPTCSISYGDDGGALAYRLGAEGAGLQTMFVIMNAARLTCATQAYAIAEAAYQGALEYARVRVQSKAVTGDGEASVAIVEHPDVRRMLMDMKSQIEAMRALTLFAAATQDRALKEPDEAVRARHRDRADFLIPIVKGWSTETAVTLTSQALQVFGGMGFIEETGVAQKFRDVRAASIYEGTTGIQGGDLVRRKLLRDGGRTARGFIEEMRDDARRFADGASDLRALAEPFDAAIGALAEATAWICVGTRDVRDIFAVSVPYLMLWGVVGGAWMMAKSAAIAFPRCTDPFYAAKLATANYYMRHALTRAHAYGQEVLHGAPATFVLDESAFDAAFAALAYAPSE